MRIREVTGPEGTILWSYPGASRYGYRGNANRRAHRSGWKYRRGGMGGGEGRGSVAFRKRSTGRNDIRHKAEPPRSITGQDYGKGVVGVAVVAAQALT
jgi:hypothetical protein